MANTDIMWSSVCYHGTRPMQTNETINSRFDACDVYVTCGLIGVIVLIT